MIPRWNCKRFFKSIHGTKHLRYVRPHRRVLHKKPIGVSLEKHGTLWNYNGFKNGWRLRCNTPLNAQDQVGWLIRPYLVLKTLVSNFGLLDFKNGVLEPKATSQLLYRFVAFRETYTTVL